MDYIPSEDILHVSVHLYNFIGEFTKYNLKILYLYRLLNCLLFGLNLVSMLASLSQAEGTMYIKSMEGIITTVHVCISLTIN